MISIALCRWSSATLPPKSSGRGFSIKPTPSIQSWQVRWQRGATISRSQLQLFSSDLPRSARVTRSAEVRGLSRAIAGLASVASWPRALGGRVIYLPQSSSCQSQLAEVRPRLPLYTPARSAGLCAQPACGASSLWRRLAMRRTLRGLMVVQTSLGPSREYAPRTVYFPEGFMVPLGCRMKSSKSYCHPRIG